jgi:hypothetical protein
LTDKPHYCAPGECRKFATWPPRTYEITAVMNDGHRLGASHSIPRNDVALVEYREAGQLIAVASPPVKAELAEAEFYLAQRDK